MSAVATQAAANIEIARARRSGFTARSVREGGLYKIRIGPYETRDEAGPVLTQVKSRLGGRPFIVRVP
jgi:cell division septation protein DedD